MVPKILVVDDEENLLRLFQRVLGKEGYEVRTAGSGTEALRLLQQEDFDLIISDLVMPILGGLELMQAVKEDHPDLPFVLITAFGSIGSAVEAIKAGAFDYLTKPFHKEEILTIVRKALKVSELRQEVKRLRDELKTLVGFNRLIFKSKAMESVFKLIHKVADSQATVLIQGESGTGKELVARALHDLSRRRDGPFIAVDCSVLPEALLQTELFGHVKGAFTGAAKDKEGLFLAAHRGTLFLDEIGNIAPAVQLNLLRVLQEKEIKPVGSVASTKVDVRVLAATNMDLEQLIKKGTFPQGPVLPSGGGDHSPSATAGPAGGYRPPGLSLSAQVCPGLSKGSHRNFSPGHAFDHGKTLAGECPGTGKRHGAGGHPFLRSGAGRNPPGPARRRGPQLEGTTMGLKEATKGLDPPAGNGGRPGGLERQPGQ